MHLFRSEFILGIFVMLNSKISISITTVSLAKRNLVKHFNMPMYTEESRTTIYLQKYQSLELPTLCSLVFNELQIKEILIILISIYLSTYLYIIEIYLSYHYRVFLIFINSYKLIYEIRRFKFVLMEIQCYLNVPSSLLVS